MQGLQKKLLQNGLNLKVFQKIYLINLIYAYVKIKKQKYI